MKKNTSSSQVLVNATVRKKRGPYNKLSKQKRLDDVGRLYFEEGYSKVDIAENLRIHRNTVTSDVECLIEEFKKQGGQDEIVEYGYKQKSLFNAQKFRLLKKLKAESDFSNELKIEKILLGLYDKEMKFYLKFLSKVKKSPKVSTKSVKKIIRDLAFAEYSFSPNDDLIRTIIRKIKCDVDTARSIISEMANLGLHNTSERFGEAKSMMEFANMCGCMSDKEYSKIGREISKREEREKREDEKLISDFNEEFTKKYGDSKNWTQDIRRQYNADYMDYWDAHSG